MQLAVALIRSPRRGTAFAIDRQTALTAWHCVRDPKDESKTVESVELRFEDDEVATAEVGEGDTKQDWAVLELTAPLPLTLRPIPLRAEAQPWELCRCLGFPITAAEYGFLPLRATVTGETQRQGIPVLALETEVAGAGLDVAGLSGGPVVPRRTPDEAVGVMSRRLLREEQQVGVLFACPTRLFMDRPFAQLDPEPEAEAGSTEDRLAEAAAAGDAGAAARLGNLLQSAGDRSGAEPWFRQAALAGHPSSAYAVGILMDPDGTLAERDPERAREALSWFRRGAAGGDVYAQTTMGIRLRQQHRDDAALPWLEEAVERGADAMAAHTLGRIYEDLNDKREAERWERFAAKRGDVRAAFDLGRMLNARGKRDEAISWLTRAKLDPDAVELLRELGVDPDDPPPPTT